MIEFYIRHIVRGRIMNIVLNIFNFYREGFANMKLGKTLWKIIAFKFIVFILVMKIFFFPNFLKTNFQNDEERSSHVLENLTEKEE